MEQLQVLTRQATEETPFISFDPVTGVFLIKGVSVPERPEDFYADIYKWLDQYIKNPQPQTTLKCFIFYFNTSSAIRLLGILKKMKKLHDNGNSVTIKWIVFEDDPDMIEAGEDYQSILEIPFDFVEVTDEELDLATI